MKYKLVLLAGDTLRARAYAQTLQKHTEDYSIKGFFYGVNKSAALTPSISDAEKDFYSKNNLFIPDFNESILTTFNKNNWEYFTAENKDVNSSEVLEGIARFGADLVVFAGFGGQILSHSHFETSHNYLHMHPGDLPLERGSTTIYYSILNRRKCTVTAFFMSKEIDAGRNVFKQSYNLPLANANIDLYYDNIVRANCFQHALMSIHKMKPFIPDQYLNNCEYYVIHPVLKHLALLSLKE